MIMQALHCPYCQGTDIIRHGTTRQGKQRYRCQNPDCLHQSFLLNPAYKGRLPEIKERIVDMALSGSGIRDTARVLGISTDTVINELKKRVGTDLGQSALAGRLVARRCGSSHPSGWRSRNG